MGAEADEDDEHEGPKEERGGETDSHSGLGGGGSTRRRSASHGLRLPSLSVAYLERIVVSM